MKQGILGTIGLLGAMALVFVSAPSAWAVSVGGPHLWLASDGCFDECGPDYVGSSLDAWLSESDVTSSPFDLSIFNADKYNPAHETAAAATAFGLHLLIVVHDGETGTVTVDGTDYSVFGGNDLGTTGYGGGNHGVYQPPASHDGVFADLALGVDLGPLSTYVLPVSWSGFSQVHFDAYSDNGYYNPASHDVTGTGVPEVPEPGTLVLLGSGLMGLAGWGRRKMRKGGDA